MSWLNLFTRGTRLEKDPVCGMDVDPTQAAASTDYQGKRYHFCAPSCLKAFQENPEQYAEATKVEAAAREGHQHGGRKGHGCC